MVFVSLLLFSYIHVTYTIPHYRIDRRSLTPSTFNVQLLLSSAGFEVFNCFAPGLFESRDISLTPPHALLDVHDMGLLTIIRKNRRKEREMRVLFL